MSQSNVQEAAQEKVRNRALVVIGALLIQLCLGAIYAWSVFTPYLVEPPFNFSRTQTQTVFSVGLATFAVVMVLAGKWESTQGPQIVAIAGGILLGTGYVLAGLFGRSFIGQVIFIGLVGGAGIGLAYVCPIACGMRWFPDKRGLITGIAVAGFGFGAIIWVKLAGSWGNLLETMGVLRVFFLYGIIFAAAILIGSMWMVNPPAGWCPPGWDPNGEEGEEGTENALDVLPAQMLRTPQFYGVWIMFIFSSMAGLMTIGNIKLFGIEALQGSGLTAKQASAVAGTAMAVFYSLANGLGRIVWGALSDQIGRAKSLILMCGLQGVMMLLFYWMGGSIYLLYLGATVIGFNFGGNFALFPTVTADLFGAQNVGQNYGWVFTAYGVGGIIGPIMAGAIRDVGQGWMPPFIISGIACLIAAIIGTRLRPPTYLVEE